MASITPPHKKKPTTTTKNKKPNFQKPDIKSW